jgi:acetyl esterase/lipase
MPQPTSSNRFDRRRFLQTTAATAALGLSAARNAPAQQADAQKKGVPADFDMAAYLSGISAKGKAAGYKEVVYKKTPQGELRMYLALPQDWSPQDRRPAVVYFYGGAWSGGNVFSYDEQAAYMAKCGVVGIMADYRVRTRHGVTPDKCVEDAKSAVRWIRANCQELGVDPNRIIAGGGSAGAHIAACTAVASAPNSEGDDLSVSCTPNGLLLCFPPTTVIENERGSPARQLLGEEMALRLSPASHVTKAWPPTVQFFGTADRLLTGGVLLHNRMRAVGVPCELYLAEGQGHGFVNMDPWHVVSSKYAADFFMTAGLFEKVQLPDAPADKVRRYDGEPLDTILIQTTENPSRKQLEERKRKAKAK